MPRKKITISDKVEYLSILNTKAEVDKKLEPVIADDFLLKLYRTMFLARKFDERLLSLQRQGRIGTFPPISGQEAAHLGAAAALQPADWMVPAFRETAAELQRLGIDLDKYTLLEDDRQEAFGGILEEKSWDSSDTINLNLDFLPVGVYVVNIRTYNEFGVYASDSVLISVLLDLSTTQDSETNKTSGLLSDIELDDLGLGLVAGFAVFGLVLVGSKIIRRNG